MNELGVIIVILCLFVDKYHSQVTQRIGCIDKFDKFHAVGEEYRQDCNAVYTCQGQDEVTIRPLCPQPSLRKGCKPEGNPLRNDETFENCCDIFVCQCDLGTFGTRDEKTKKCQGICHCENNYFCDPTSGFCDVSGGTSQCAPGYTDFPACQTAIGKPECPDGKFGLTCELDCRCDNAAEICDKVDGRCPSGCAAGYTGAGCQNKCKTGTFGVACEGICNCLDGKACRKDDGTCSNGCPLGYMKPDCSEKCRDGKFGKNCEETCNCLNEKEACGKVKGTCRSGCAKGYRGQACRSECQDGLFGSDCKFKCKCRNEKEICGKKEGRCESGCQAGYMNAATGGCSETCKNQTFGLRCSFMCNCFNETESCDAITGECTSGCPFAMRSPSCQIACPNMTFGPDCTQTCKCVNPQEPCYNNRGHCYSGCATGYEGQICQIIMTTEGPPESTGLSTLAIGLISAAAVILVIIVIGVIILVVFRKRKLRDRDGGVSSKKQHPSFDRSVSVTGKSIRRLEEFDDVYQNIDDEKLNKPIQETNVDNHYEGTNTVTTDDVGYLVLQPDYEPLRKDENEVTHEHVPLEKLTSVDSFYENTTHENNNGLSETKTGIDKPDRAVVEPQVKQHNHHRVKHSGPDGVTVDIPTRSDTSSELYENVDGKYENVNFQELYENVN